VGATARGWGTFPRKGKAMGPYHKSHAEDNPYAPRLKPPALYRFREEYRGPQEERELRALTDWLHRRWGYWFSTLWYRRSK
jgi:hypothetical protein